MAENLQELRKELYNAEAEQIILGTIILNNEYLNRVSEFLLPEHFYEPAHQKIYSQILHNVEKVNITANQVTLKQFFDSDESIKAAGGAAYLASLVSQASMIVDIAQYARLIYDLALKRELVMIGEEIVVRAYKTEDRTTADEQIEKAESNLFKLTNSSGGRSDFRNIAASMKETIDRTTIARKRDSHISGVSTGLVDLDKMLGGMQNSDLIILAGRPSMGKAQPLDSLILTANAGFKRMGDIKIGDELASVNGNKSKVNGIFPQGKKQIYRIKFSDDRFADCCAEHLWRVYYRDWIAPRILSTKQIILMLEKSRYQNRLWIDRFCGEYKTKNNKLPLDPWLLGALLGDGTLSDSSLRFSNQDDEILKKLSKKIAKDFKINFADGCDYRIVQKNSARNKGKAGVTPNKIKNILEKIGLWNIYSENKFIPEQFLFSSKEDRLNLLTGLIDTDGWVEKQGTIRYATSSKKLANGVIDLVRSLGGIAIVNEKTPSYTHHKAKKDGLVSYVINIHCLDDELKKTLTKIKASKIKPKAREKRLTIKEIKKTKIAEAQCISVSHEDHLYITDNFVTTHNTALAINLAVNACKFLNKDGDEKNKKAVGFFSLEMSADQLSARILSMETSINATKFRTGQLTDMEWEAIAARSGEISKWPFFIDDTPALSIAAIRTRTRRMIRKHNLGFVLIDYLQLVKGVDSRGSDNRVQEISEITQGLKAIAKEFNIPVMALSQLSRAVEQREDKRPQLSDLRESGSIEQDADVVAFIYRESYYHERKQPPEADIAEFEKWKTRMQELRNVSEVIIAKQRNGPIGNVHLYFDAEFTKFGNLDTYHSY